MSHAATATTESEPRYLGAIAEFPTGQSLLHAAEKVRDAGYTKWDCHTPYPVHGLDEAVGIKPTTLPYVVVAGGLTGLLLGTFMQWYCSSAEVPAFGIGSGYPIVISGKPHFGAHAVPICFELTILLGSFGAFFGMLLYNGLPLFHNPLFANRRFRRATDDKLFIVIDSTDPKFDRRRTREFLQGLHADAVEIFEEPATDSKFPGGVVIAWIMITLAALIPPALVARARTGTSETPGATRWIDKGMARQPKYNTQLSGAQFADGRTMRHDLAGTVARGELEHDSHRDLGLVRSPARTAAGFAGGASAAAAADRYADGLPASLIAGDDGKPSAAKVKALMARGRERFNIHCAACHGDLGDGQGRVHDKASRGENAEWVQPQVLNGSGQNGALVKGQADGRIFNTITFGRNTMQPMGSRVPVDDRWAIVLYVRALQRAFDGKASELTPEQQKELAAAK